MTEDSVRIPVAAARLGYTVKAIERKIQSGVWLQGVHWVKAPDGHLFVDMVSVRNWISGIENQVKSGRSWLCGPPWM